MELKELDQDSLVDDDEDRHHNDFKNLYHVSIRAKNKSATENMKREITQRGKKRVFEMFRGKKRRR